MAKTNALIVAAKTQLAAAAGGLPALVQAAGKPAATAWRDFFKGRLAGNANTRIAYERAVRQFLSWCDERHLDLEAIRPGDVGEYFTDHPGGPSTKKQHLSALRRYFNLLVERHICLINPASVAETERIEVVEGKTPEVTAAEIQTLLASIDSDKLVGRRDLAAISVLIYTAARAGAVARLRRGDFHGRPGANPTSSTYHASRSRIRRQRKRSGS